MFRFFLLLLVGLLAAAPVAAAEVLVVAPDGPYTSIEAALAVAQQGDTIEVHGGVYPGPLVIEQTVSLVGVDQPVIDGGGEGTTVVIDAPGVLFQGFTVRNTGDQPHNEDSGIIIQADNVTVADNTLENILFGIYFADADNGVARNNRVVGRDRDLALRGDGIRVWFSNNVALIGNEVFTTRDTLIWFADGIIIEDNYIHDSRYGLHFMYSSRAVVERNTFAENSIGTYLMYSQELSMRDNTFAYNRGPSGYGIALKDMDEVVVSDNVMVGNRAGLYIDNSPSLYEGFNTFSDNLFAYNDVGVVTQPAAERNVFTGNTFLENLQQAGTRGRGTLQGNVWHQDGQGNYWSDYAGYDADGDGVGDMPYRSEKLFENLMDSYPELRLFIYSPASQAIEFAASAFPSLRPEPKLVDEAPAMQYELAAPQSTTASLSLLSVSLLLVALSGGVVLFARWLALPRYRVSRGI